ncbi:MAG: hypothetical protein HOM68_01855 [Gemmatimonadetes bacterium]|jgi:hypothetical protein|nr:hypothetical protein [Gemmatimonadota bacterium]MBT5055258.1 hypothetical protein [Gemmatimonadota bacterium]MBT5144704.1 hypothetical protein [Gemmatimonadota bacterium]MBT5963315.1 hypothetical protein [Gemmatimonadota bacterium]MBT7456075.1 hypothetical protein [Gemmatimonadota bacterium]
MTDWEKWHFDLHGYVILRNVVSHSDLKHMVQRCDEWQALADTELPSPMSTAGGYPPGENASRAIINPEFVDPVYADLQLNDEIMRVVLTLTDNSPQHLQCALIQNHRGCTDGGLHNGAEGGMRNPANDYQAADGKIFATFINAGVSLVDVPAGSGFVVVPGSHKSHFAAPDDLTVDSDPPSVVNLPLNAGDCVVFTELLRHGARRWTLDTPRKTVFCRYATSYASWSPGNGPIEEHRDLLSDDLYELKQMAGFQKRKNVVDKLLARRSS